MHLLLPRRHALALALGTTLAATAPVQAQQVVADGDEQTPAAGDYTTTDPVEPGNPAGHAFLARNGGTIMPLGEVNLRTEGDRAAGAHVEGAGSRIVLTGGSVQTSGYGAAGLSAVAGGALDITGMRIETQGTTASGLQLEDATAIASNVHITTHGGLAHGVSLRQGSVELRDSVIEVNGSSSNGIFVSGGTLLAERVRIEQNGAGNAVTVQAGPSADVTLRAVDINGNQAGAAGVLAGRGSSVVLEDVNIVLSHDRSSEGLSIGGDVVMRGGRIHTAGDGASVVSIAQRGKGTLEGVDIRGQRALFMWADSTLDLRNSTLRSANIGININQSNSTASIAGSSITADTGEGILVAGDSTLTLVGSTVTTHGTLSPAVSLFRGQATLEGSVLRTTGGNGHGLYADGSNTGSPVATATRVDILTSGAGAIGAIARQGGTTHLADSVIRTTGAQAHGVLSGGRGEMTLTNTHVRTEGENAWAAVINDNGRMTIDGGSLVSAQHGGVWLRSSRDPGLTLSSGAMVSGGNGIGLALDAAVAGRFDVALEGRSQLLGDIVITPEDEDAGLVPQSDVHVRLADGSLWAGTSDLVQTLALEGGSQWTLTGGATVGELQARDSVVALSDGSGRFNTLTVDGDLHSEGALFLFHGALAGDDSAIDHLHVRGDTSGDALIAVNNIGGVGAPTVDGIQLIEVEGASLASYTLTGRAVGGAYEYFLYQGGMTDPNDGNWYLRSQWFDVCEDDPAAPGCAVDPGPGPGPGPDPGEGGEGGEGIGPVDPIRPPPVLRPEAGAYLANQSAAVNMFAHRLSDRTGALNSGDGLNAWARVGRQQSAFSAVGGQLSVDGSTSVLQIGSDLLRRGDVVFGVMLGSGRADSSVVSQLTGYGAKGRVRGNAVGVYGTWLQNGGGDEGAYVDANVQVGHFDNRVHGVGLEHENYDARMASASLESGHTFNVWQGASSALYLQPQLQLSYVDFRADRHVESNGTVVDGSDAGGFSGRVGVRAFGRSTAAGNMVQPYLGVNWLRSSGASTLHFNGQTLGADVPRNRYEVQAGAELKLGQRWGMWGGLTVQRGDHGYRNVGGQMGMRVAW